MSNSNFLEKFSTTSKGSKYPLQNDPLIGHKIEPGDAKMTFLVKIINFAIFFMQFGIGKLLLLVRCLYEETPNRQRFEFD